VPARTVPRADQRARLLEVALRLLEESGPEVLQARRLTSEIGTSTQAVYTLFGGMPGLFEALVADGFERFARFVDAVPETDDPVADFFTKGGAYCQWAFEHPQLYRLMFGLTAGRLRGDGVLITAHGNSLRALIMALDGLSPDEIVRLELATGVPVTYRINPDATVEDKQTLTA